MLGIPWDEVHEEAERLEHAMSPVLEERMRAAIGDAKTCPHGHPIDAGDRIEGVPLADVEVGAKVRILRFENEAEDLLHYLKDAGIEPGLEGTVARPTTSTSSSTSTAPLRAHALGGRDGLGAADPSPPPRTALPEQLVPRQGPLRLAARPPGASPPRWRQIPRVLAFARRDQVAQRRARPGRRRSRV